MPARRPTLSAETYTREEVLAIQQQVRRRDKGRCVLCGRNYGEVHELKFKSSGVRGAKRIFIQRCMACLCKDHHTALHSQGGQRLLLTMRILIVLRARYGYVYKPRLDRLITAATVAIEKRRPPFDRGV